MRVHMQRSTQAILKVTKILYVIFEYIYETSITLNESNDFLPYIKIGNGSRNFTSIYYKAIKNHKQIHVSGGYKIEIALQVYMGLRKDFCVFGSTCMYAVQ